MAYAAMNTLDALDVMGVEVELDMALDDLKDALGQDPDAGPLVQWVCNTVERVENSVVHGPETIRANVEALRKVKDALAKLGIPAREAQRHLDAYLSHWQSR